MIHRPLLPVVLLALALVALVAAQALSETGLPPATQPANLLCYGLMVLAAVLSARGSRFTPLVVWLAAAGGVRCLYTAQPMMPLPAIAWARGSGLEPPQHLFPLIFSGSVFGVGQISAIVLWTGAMAAAALPRRSERLPAIVLAFFGAAGTVLCALAPLPMISNELVVAQKGAAEGDLVPTWTDGELVERVWTRSTREPAPSIGSRRELMKNDAALSEIAQGMAVSTHGPSPLRNVAWTGARVSSWLQFRLRLVALVAAMASLPVCVGLAFRSAPRARFLGLPGQALLWLVAGANTVLGLLACVLPEGGVTAATALPYHFALLGFVGAAALASRQLRAGSEVSP